MKPFDLAAFINGAFAVTRAGDRAAITSIMLNKSHPLIGSIEDRHKIYTWTTSGLYGVDGEYSDHDLVGMWEEHKTNVFEGRLEWTAPCEGRLADDCDYWYIDGSEFGVYHSTETGHYIDGVRFENRNYFATSEAAQSFANALKTFSKGSVSNPPPSEPQTA